MKSFIKGVVVTIIVLAVIIVLGLGYLGFIPVVSSVFGSNKPRDLGVTYTAADLSSARAKAGRQVTELAANLPPGQSLTFSGQKAVDVSLTQAEFNAFINDKWEYYPVTDVQVKIGQDGVAEVSGILRVDRFHGLAETLQVPQAVRDRVKDYLKYVPANLPFYLKGTAAIDNGQITTFNFPEVQISKVSIPQSALTENKQNAIDATYWFMSRIPGFSAKTFNLNGGKVNFNGNMPATKAYSPAG